MDNRDRHIKILFACVQNLDKLTLAMNLSAAKDLLDVRDGIGTVHNELQQELLEEAAAKKADDKESK